MNFRPVSSNAPLLVFSTYVLAMDRVDGRQLWLYSTGDKPVRRFAIDDDRIFAYDSAGVMHCIALANGAPIGRVDTKLENASNMLVDGGLIYLAADEDVIALDRDGRILWRQRIPDNRSWSLAGLAVPGGNSSQPDFSTST